MRGRRGRCKSDEVARESEKATVHRESDEEADGDEAVKGFFACYLLCSLSPRHKGHTYIGFTVNPRRRIKQHNGEKRCGAWRTKCGRPWEMALCIYGFPSNVSALQFEWAWQHPKESLAVRKAASNFKSLSGIANKIKLAYAMITLSCWENLNLTVNFFSTKYMKHTAGCPRLPNQMRVTVCSMDDLPCYVEGEDFHCSNFHDEDVGERDLNDIITPGSTDGAVEQIYKNIDQTGSSSQIDQTGSSSQIDQTGSSSHILWKPTSYNFDSPRSSMSSLPLELNDFECMMLPTSLNTSSCSEDGGTKKLNHSTPRSFENKTTIISPKFDVINLCTPSSGIIQSKTKRALFASEIVDLTDSPMIILL